MCSEGNFALSKKHLGKLNSPLELKSMGELNFPNGIKIHGGIKNFQFNRGAKAFMLIFKSGIIDTRSTLILQEITHFCISGIGKKGSRDTQKTNNPA